MSIDISIIMPSDSNRDELELTLTVFNSQTYPSDRYEFIVDRLTKRRQIQVDFYEPINIDLIREKLKIAQLELRKINDYTLTISFDKSEVSEIDIIQKILDYFHPHAMKIEAQHLKP